MVVIDIERVKKREGGRRGREKAGKCEAWSIKFHVYNVITTCIVLYVDVSRRKMKFINLKKIELRFRLKYGLNEELKFSVM